MSFQAMTWAVKQKVGNATGKAVLLMLANYADESGECYPSQERLATECECSISTVQRWLKSFEDCGALERQKQYGDGGYRRADRLRLRTDLQVTKLHSREIPSAEKPISVPELTPHKAVAEPVKEPSSLRSLSSRAQGVDAFRKALAPILGPELIETLIQARRNKRATINANAGALLLKALGRCPDPVAAAEEMAVRGWTGVKPQWLESQQRTGPPVPKRGVGGVFDQLGDYFENGQGNGNGDHQAPQGAVLRLPDRSAQ